MTDRDDFSSYYAELLDGIYDCVDRIVLNGHYPLGMSGGGFRTWWRALTGADETLGNESLKRLAGRFSRRVRAWAAQHGVKVIDCPAGERKHLVAAEHLPKDPGFKGVFLILVAKAPALVWKVTPTRTGAPHLERTKPWPYVNHYHVHIIDPEWGHLVIKMSGHPPFSVQIMLNGHEWVDRRARKQTDSIALTKEGNCFVGGSIQAADQLANALRSKSAIGRLAAVCDRWIYTSCLCFALDIDEQRRSGFRYRYSCLQLEYSRNLLFHRGTTLDQVYQGLIDRTRAVLGLQQLKTILGWKHRPHLRRKNAPRLERIVNTSEYDLTVFKIHFGALTLKIYDKGARVLRIEAIAHNAGALKRGKRLEKFPVLVAELRRMAIAFLNALQAAHLSTIDDGALDQLPLPSQRGTRRLAGIDLAKPRMRAVCEALLSLAPHPDGFTAKELAAQTGRLHPQLPYTQRHAAYDLAKLRGKHLIERIARSRRYRVCLPAVRTLVGLLILREKVIKPVLAGARGTHQGRPANTIHPLDQHYLNLQREMRHTFETLKLAA
jgi:hypothetical protein